MIKDIAKVQDKVEILLERYPELRDNDKLLWLAYMNTNHSLRDLIGEETYQTLKRIILNSPTFESISRARRKIQETMYQGDKEKRLEEAENMSNWATGKQMNYLEFQDS